MAINIAPKSSDTVILIFRTSICTLLTGGARKTITENFIKIIVHCQHPAALCLPGFVRLVVKERFLWKESMILEEQDSQYTFQKYAIALMCETIKMCKRNGDGRNMLESYGSKNTFKSGLIAHYASMYYLKDEKRYINFWQNNIQYSDALLMSKKAKKIIGVIKNDYNGSLNKYKNDPQNKNDDAKLYWEHITPNEVVWQRYLNVFDRFSQNKLSEEDLKKAVDDCFDGHKLALITKAEAAGLDQNGRTGNNHTGCKPNEDISKFKDIAVMRIKEIRDSLECPKRFGTIEEYLQCKEFII